MLKYLMFLFLIGGIFGESRCSLDDILKMNCEHDKYVLPENFIASECKLSENDDYICRIGTGELVINPKDITVLKPQAVSLRIGYESCCLMTTELFKKLIQEVHQDGCLCYKYNKPFKMSGEYLILDNARYNVSKNKDFKNKPKPLYEVTDDCALQEKEVDLLFSDEKEVKRFLISSDAKVLVNKNVEKHLKESCSKSGYVQLGKIRKKCENIIYRTCEVNINGLFQVPKGQAEVLASKNGDKVFTFDELFDVELFKENSAPVYYVKGTYADYLNRFSNTTELENVTIYFELYDLKDRLDLIDSDGFCMIRVNGRFVGSCALVDTGANKIVVTAAHLNLPDYVEICAQKCICAYRIKFNMEGDYDLDFFKPTGLDFRFLSWSQAEMGVKLTIYKDIGQAVEGDLIKIKDEKRSWYETTFTDLKGGMSGGPVVQNGQIIGVVTGTSWVWNMPTGFVTIIPQSILYKIDTAFNNELIKLDSNECMAFIKNAGNLSIFDLSSAWMRTVQNKVLNPL